MEREYKRSRRYKKDSAEQIFIRTLRRSICSMILCTVCLISSTWAWFVASAESQVAVIRLGETTVTVTPEKTTYSGRRASIKRGEDGEFKMPAGTYVISVEPISGSAPMYCLIDIETEIASEDRIEQAIAEFNEDMEEEWIPVLATDSNSIMVLENEEELEAYETELEENENFEEFEYEILSIPVVEDDIYRVIWEPEEERTFVLNLEEDAIVSFEASWLTEEEMEEEYPELDKLTGCNYVVIYPKNVATPANAANPTTEAVEFSTLAESASAAANESTAATENSTESTSSAATESTSEESASTESAIIESTSETTASTEPATEGTSESVTESSTEATTEVATEPSSEMTTEPATTIAEAPNTETTAAPSTEISVSEAMTEDVSISISEQTDTTEAISVAPSESVVLTKGNSPVYVVGGVQEDETISPEMSTEEIESLAE